MQPTAVENFMTSNATWMQRDLAVLWHPCTQMKDHEKLPIIPIRRGEGVWLEDFDGNRYLDAVSSWWVNVFGHGNPRINARIRDQLDQLEHVMLAGFSHAPVVELSERLVALTPQGLDRVFYADNGSSGIEVALKMSHHYWINQGQPGKKRFITLTNSYHGETVAAMSVGDVSLFTETYRALLLDCIKVASPDCYLRETGESWEAYSRRMFQHMERALAEHAHEAAAVIVEPLIQGAGGMRMYHPIYLTLLREACNRYGVHLIHDEIAVGFGRTGTMFACEQAGITPDFLILSKALTGGYLPMAAVLTTNDVYHAFYDEYETLRAFLHSHTYTGNPLACAAALATLDIFEQDNVIEANKALAARMASATAHLVDHPHVAEVRQTGMALAIEMVQDKSARTPYPWQERRGLTVYQHALSRGALLRPLGNVVYFLPPYVITPEQIDFLAQVATEGIDHATKSGIQVSVDAHFYPDHRDPG
jgi:adenosylmethionine-8-amino-7-oxononanoate aminotransferase